MKAKELLDQYLKTKHTMQLATQADGKPWVCTVRFVADEDNSLFWISLPTRRHSQDVEQQPSVAATVVVHDVVGEPVIAVQLEGAAEQVKLEDYDEQIVNQYATSFLRDQQWVEDFLAGASGHCLYKLSPTTVYLFDERNFPGGERQQVK